MNQWSLTADEFNSLPQDVQSQGLEWIDAAAPDHFTLEAHFLAEGRVRLMCAQRRTEELRRKLPVDTIRWCWHTCNLGSPCWQGVGFLKRAIYTTLPPPPAILEAAARFSNEEQAA